MKTSWLRNCVMLLSLICLISGCSLISDELSRSEAKSQLLNFFENNMYDFRRIFIQPVVEHTIEKKCLADPVTCLLNFPIYKDLKPLYQAGHFKYEYKVKIKKGTYWDEYLATFTIIPSDSLKKKIDKDNRLVIFDLENIEITGILKNSDNIVADVDFIIRLEPNQFGKTLGEKEHSRSNKATFAKYDDGWKLMKIDDSWMVE